MKRNKLVGLFYTAPGGELKLRRFAVVAFIFIVLMIAAIVFVIFQRADANVHMATVATIPNETSPTPSQGYDRRLPRLARLTRENGNLLGIWHPRR